MADRTALITGASSGIGEEYARQFAGLGYNLVLVARRTDRLQTLAADLEARHGIQAEVLAADLADRADMRRVEERLATDDTLGVLVHAAGFGTIGEFIEKSADREVGMIDVHDVAAVRLTHAVLPGMIARRSGVVIHISSIAGLVGGAGNVVYAASKAFLNTFCQGLQAELQGTGVRIQSLCPGFTYTEFHDTAEYRDFQRSAIPRPMWMSAQAVVSDSLAALKTDKVVVVPGLRNRMVVFIARSGLVQRFWHNVAVRLRRRALAHRS
jgi:uncharacterized protein